MTANIYGLFDPRRPAFIMYVGKGKASRAKSHWQNFIAGGRVVNALMRCWFESLKAEGIGPSWKFLEERVENWQEAESRWIAHWRSFNPKLCNVSSGGNSWKMTPEENRLVSRRAGLIGGRSRANSGDLKRIGHLGGLAGGSKGGKKSGGIAFARIWKSDPEKLKKSALRGLLNGAKARDKWLREHPNELKKAGKQVGTTGLGNHIRWHLSKGLIKPECSLCRAQAEMGWENVIAS